VYIVFGTEVAAEVGYTHAGIYAGIGPRRAQIMSMALHVKVGMCGHVCASVHSLRLGHVESVPAQEPWAVLV
jgi:hypothetical protein